MDDLADTVTRGRASRAATLSLALGVFAMFAWLVPPVGALAAIVGLAAGVVGLRSAGRGPSTGRDRGRLGLVLSAIGLGMSATMMAWLVQFVGAIEGL